VWDTAKKNQVAQHFPHSRKVPSAIGSLLGVRDCSADRILRRFACF
jgi:hypothetical protein